MPIPKLAFDELSAYVMDLFLVSEENEEWVKNKTIRRVWRMDMISILIIAAVALIVAPPIAERWGDSAR
jgi:hypothetical protein